MEGSVLVGGVLAAGLGIFLVGAVAWRLEYQRPLQESLPAIHRDGRRWTWIHVWMVTAMLVTPAGLAGLTVILEEPTAAVLTAMAAAVYVSGGVCWIASLAFRLTVTPWAAEQTVIVGDVPDGFAAHDRWAGALYCVHMLAAYVASAVLGIAVLVSDALPTWLGWTGVRVGTRVRRRSGGDPVRGAVQPAHLGSPLHGDRRRASPRTLTRVEFTVRMVRA